MSDLLTLDLAKAYLKIQHTAEDDLLNVLIENAHAEIEGYLRRPVFSRAVTITDHGDSLREYESLTALYIPHTPIEEGSVVITDVNGDTVDSTTYTVNLETGIVRGDEGTTFPAPPYTIACNVGLEHREDFDLNIKPVLTSCMLDLVADAYQRRNPGAQAEGSGGGVYTQWKTGGMPERTARKLDAFRRIGIV